MTANESNQATGSDPSTNPRVQAASNHLRLKEISHNRFATLHENEGFHQVFGGQLMAQALMAASCTVEQDRKITSYHSTFLRPGRLDQPIEYRVNPVRDSRSFSTRRVTAEQNEKVLYELSVSFQKDETGLDHQSSMPSVPDPETSSQSEAIGKIYREQFPGHLPKATASELVEEPAIESRLPDVDLFLKPTGPTDDLSMWLKFSSELDLPPEHHKHMLAFASDLGISHIIAQPHGLGGFNPKMRYVTLDHAMWFHRPFRADEWLLLVRNCPSTHSGRGIVKGTVFSQDGVLVASLVQEGLVRMAA